MTTWAELFLWRERERQRREAAVALERVELARGTAAYPAELRRALCTMIESCPLVWGEGSETIEIELTEVR